MSGLDNYKKKIDDTVIELTRVEKGLIPGLSLESIELINYILSYNISRSTMDWKLRQQFVSDEKEDSYRIFLETLFNMMQDYKYEHEDKPMLNSLLSTDDISAIITILLIYHDDISHFDFIGERTNSSLGTWSGAKSVSDAFTMMNNLKNIMPDNPNID